MSDDKEPDISDIFETELKSRAGRRWVILFPDDYENFATDPEDDLAILVDGEQAAELLRLSAQSLADLSHRSAEGDDIIRDMIAELEKVIDDE